MIPIHPSDTRHSFRLTAQLALSRTRRQFKRFTAIASLSLLWLTPLNGHVAAAGATAVTTPQTQRDNTLAVPHIGDAVQAMLTPEDRVRYGEMFLRYLHSQQPTVFDPIVLNYLRYDLLPRLQDGHSHADAQALIPKLLLINSTEINAFAAPDTIMGINLGLFIHAQSESEFASVIAHELGHLHYDHFALKLHQNKNQLRNNMLLLLASILVASQAESGDAAAAVNIAGQTLSAENKAKYSRHLEREADYYALSLLADEDFDSHAMPRFFERLKRQYPVSEFAIVPSFIQTHPLTEERISYTQARANQQARPSAANKPIDDVNYQLIRTRIICLTAKNPAQRYAYYREKLHQRTALPAQQTSLNGDSSALVDAYGALICAQQADIALDEALLAALIDVQQRLNHTILRQSLLEARIHQARNNASDSKDSNSKATHITDRIEPVTHTEYDKVLAAQLYHQQKRYDRALNVLNAVKFDIAMYPQFWQLKRDNAHLREDRAALYRAEAEIAYLRNDLETAQDKLEAALKATTQFSTQAQIQHRLKAIKSLLD